MYIQIYFQLNGKVSPLSHTPNDPGWEKTVVWIGCAGVVEVTTVGGSLGVEAGINCFFGSVFFGVTGTHSFSIGNEELWIMKKKVVFKNFDNNGNFTAFSMMLATRYRKL